MTEEERREAARDLGMALELAARAARRAPLARLAASQAVPLLEAAVRDRPDDLPARESLGYALGMLDRLAEARSAYEEILRIEPRREWRSLTSPDAGRPGAARTGGRSAPRGNRGQSVAVGLSPGAGPELCPGGDWPGAVAACREAIRLNPELFEARSLLVQCYLRAPRRRRPTPSSGPCFGSTPPAARSGSSGTSGRSGRGREKWAMPRIEPATGPNSTRGSG